MLGRLAYLTLVSGLFLAGCGPATDDPSETAAGGSSGGESDSASASGMTGAESESGGGSTGGESEGESESESGSTGGGSEPGNPGSLACDPFLSDIVTGEDPVTIEIRNESDAPIYFRPVDCGGNAPIDLVDGDSSTRVHQGCGSPDCRDLILATSDGECSASCDDCEPNTLTRIDPGGIHTSVWSPRWVTRLEMDPECSGTCGGSSCDLTEEVADGSYTVRADLMATCEGDDCDCGADQTVDGTCSVYSGDVELSESRMVEGTWERPADDTMVVTVQ